MSLRTLRKPRVVTARNSTLLDRACAWGVVEMAQGALNDAARNVPALAAEHTTYRSAMTVYVSCGASSAEEIRLGLMNFGAVCERADRWREVQRAQLALNKTARTINLPEIERLDAAIDYYIEIGGNPRRAPGDGGLS